MTREEAIENITEIKKCEAGVYAEALELAIRALENWNNQYNNGFSDGEESGYYSTMIDNGQMEKPYGKNFIDIGEVEQ